MPVKPQFEWEQTADAVLLHITIKGYKKEAIHVFISDVWVKVNAPPTYLLTLDLLHEISVEGSHHYMDSEDPSILHVKLRKKEADTVWSALCITSGALGKEALRARRERAMQREEERYNEMLRSRATQHEVEKRRMVEAQWEVEKDQRSAIEHRVLAEKTEAEEDLYKWEDAQREADGSAKPQSVPTVSSTGDGCPSETDNGNGAVLVSNTTVPQVRQADTVNISIDFTPKLYTMPTRSRGDDEYYRRSRYKPVSVEDSPMFWKERADKLYRSHDWKGALDAYSESIKRDGVFLSCIMNRAACHLHMAAFKKAIDDCTLALTMVANTPASEITQERYRVLMTKLHARRGAARCWGGDFSRGVEDLRMAAAYRDPTTDSDVADDLRIVERHMEDAGIVTERDPLMAEMQSASSCYYKNQYDSAAEAYQRILGKDPYHIKARCNLAAALLQAGRFSEALTECTKVVEFCSEVAEALTVPGGLGADATDSDDEEEVDDDDTDEGEATRCNKVDANQKRKLAARLLSERTDHVYLLLKAYVRGAAALCGLKDYRKAHQFLEQAIRITPYDNDLRDDCNRLVEKIQMETLVAASTRAC